MAKAKLRKMLGDIHSEECKELMTLIATQRKETLAWWAIDYVERYCLPVLHELSAETAMIEQAIDDCRRCLRGELKPAVLKPSLKALRELGQATERHGMVVQSAVNAIATACATLTTVTNSLGFVFYSAAVSAYQQLGLEASADAYDAAALQEFRRAIATLKEVAVEDEPHPAQINWNC